jgi:hypothetical protein
MPDTASSCRTSDAPQAVPLSDAQKEDIVRAFVALSDAIVADPASATTALRYREFCEAYQGTLTTDATLMPAQDRLRWVWQLGLYLENEIEPGFWRISR